MAPLRVPATVARAGRPRVITRAEIDDWADRFGVPTEQIERDHLVSQVLAAATADETRESQPCRSSLVSCSDGCIPATTSSSGSPTPTRHLTGDIYEVRADGNHQTFRILFANEGRAGHILLSLEGFSKKTQKMPPDKIRLAARRLSDWRRRGRRES